MRPNAGSERCYTGDRERSRELEPRIVRYPVTPHGRQAGGSDACRLRSPGQQRPINHRNSPMDIRGRDSGDQSRGRFRVRAFCSVRVFRQRRGSADRYQPGGRVERTSAVDPRVHLSSVHGSDVASGFRVRSHRDVRLRTHTDHETRSVLGCGVAHYAPCVRATVRSQHCPPARVSASRRGAGRTPTGCRHRCRRGWTQSSPP